MEKEKFMARNGDLLVESIDKLPKGAKVKKDNVILSASHDHIIEGEAKIYTSGDDVYLKVTGKANLNHEEHKKIDLPVGIYKVIRQVEWPATEAEPTECTDYLQADECQCPLHKVNKSEGSECKHEIVYVFDVPIEPMSVIGVSGKGMRAVNVCGKAVKLADLHPTFSADKAERIILWLNDNFKADLNEKYYKIKDFATFLDQLTRGER